MFFRSKGYQLDGTSCIYWRYDINISAQVLVLCLLALNLVGAAEEEVQEEATGEVF